MLNRTESNSDFKDSNGFKSIKDTIINHISLVHKMLQSSSE
jgi:hypothetical protein